MQTSAGKILNFRDVDRDLLEFSTILCFLDLEASVWGPVCGARVFLPGKPDLTRRKYIQK